MIATPSQLGNYKIADSKPEIIARQPNQTARPASFT